MKFQTPTLEQVIFHQFREKTFRDYEPKDVEQQYLLKIVREYCDNIQDAWCSGLGLTITGPPGIGKSLLTNLVLREAHTAGYTIEAIDMTSFVALFHQKFELMRIIECSDPDEEILESWNNLDHRLHYLRRMARFTLFDDVGKEYDSGSGWSNAMWDWFLRYRYNHGLVTLITSNIPISEWAERYSPSMESFLHEATIVVEVNGSDYRKWSTRGTG